MVQLYCHFMETRRKAPCGQAASVGVPVGCVRIAKAALRYCTCVVLLSENVRKYIYMMKKISRRSFLQVCGITAAAAALTACGGTKTETAKKDDAHEAITFMAPYKEIEAFIEQVHSVYPEVNIGLMWYWPKHNPVSPVTWSSWKSICTESSWSGASASLRW